MIDEAFDDEVTANPHLGLFFSSVKISPSAFHPSHKVFTRLFKAFASISRDLQDTASMWSNQIER